jgi:hypothetical protein
MSVSNWLVLMALIAVGTVLVSGEGSAIAQEPTYQQTQYAVDVPPPVDLPSAAAEADMFPPTRDDGSSVPDQDYDGDSIGQPYFEGPYADDGPLEPTPAIGGPVLGDRFLTNTGAGAYDTFGPAQDGPPPIYSTGSWWWRGNWYTQMDVVVLNRRDHREIPLLIGAGAQNVDDVARHESQPGTRLTLGRFLGRDAASRDHLVEFAFLGLFGWEAGRELVDQAPPGMGTITTQISLDPLNDFNAAFVNSDAQGFFYDSDYNDFQVNYRLQTRPGKDVMALQPNGLWVRHATSSQVRSMFAGLRVSSINEETVYTGRQFGQISRTDVTDGLDGTVTQEDVVTADDATRGRYVVNTNNDMFGIHFGGQITEKHNDWSWGLRGRVGGLVNLISRRSLNQARLRDQVNGDPTDVQRENANGDPLFVDDMGNITTTPTDNPLIDTFTPITFQARDIMMGETVSDQQLSFVLEAGLFGKYQVRPNLAFRAGYDVMLYSSVALAPENLGLDNGFIHLNTNGTPVYYGGYAGFETTW